jgi:hypothetical protein
MINSQTYCDQCGKRTNFPDAVLARNHALGTLTLDLCWECSEALYLKFKGLQETTASKRTEAVTLAMLEPIGENDGKMETARHIRSS